MTNLSTRIAEAKADQQEEMLRDLWKTIHGPCPVTAGKGAVRWLLEHDPFSAMLNANAYLSAAEMMVPEGLSFLLAGSPKGAVCDVHGKTLGDIGKWYGQAKAATPALALAAAIAKALGNKP